MSAAKVAAQPHYAPRNYNPLTFFTEHASQYQALWDILGWRWDNLFFAAAQAANEILGKDHSVLNPGLILTGEQQEAVLDQLAHMGWFDGLTLRPGVYNNLLAMGAKYRAMVVRAEMLLSRLNTSNTSFKRTYVLLGQRPRTDDLDGCVAAIYAGLTDKVKSHPWVIEQMKLMEDDDAYSEWHGAFSTEFELGILSLIVAADGDIEIGNFVLCKDTHGLPGVPPRVIESCEIMLPNGRKMTAINAPAVDRGPKRPPRPTSASTTEYWLKHYGVQSGDTVVAVTVRVHGRRMMGDIENTIHLFDPTVNVIGYADRVDEPKLFFNQALSEAVNQLVNAAGASFNNVRPVSLPSVTPGEVRMLLNELYHTPNKGMLTAILAAVIADDLGTVPQH
jgi:hypothetical protein